MRAALERAGISAGRIFEDPTARDTVENVLGAAALLRGRAGQVLAVSHAYHLPRCVLLLQLSRLPARRGLTAGGAGGALPARLWQWLREVPALPWDVLQVLLRR
jgi:uncharacterized SAM-binding protein YcdF (DUF218 family)